MQAPAQMNRLCHRQRGLSIPSGSRILIVSHAKRRGGGASKELQELRQLKDAPAPPPTAAPSAAAPPPPAPTPVAGPGPQSASPPAPLPPAPAAQAPAPAAPAAPGVSPASPSAPLARPSGSPSSSPSSSDGGSADVGFFDSLAFRIPLAVIAIMAVINVFYSIVFFGASNAVVVFKDQLAAITKKDFVPYSERRRMEQEVLAKLEAELQEKQRAREAAVAAAGEAGVPPPLAAASEASEGAGADGSAELLTLLPSTGRR